MKRTCIKHYFKCVSFISATIHQQQQQQQQHTDNSDANTTSIEDDDSNAAKHLKQSMQFAVQRYDAFRHVVGKRVLELETLVWHSADVCDKLDALAAVLNTSVENCDYEEAIGTHADKLRAQIDDNRATLDELERRKQALDELRRQLTSEWPAPASPQTTTTNTNTTNDNLNSSTTSSNSAQSSSTSNGEDGRDNMLRKLDEMDEMWHQLHELSEYRAGVLVEALECASTYWSDVHSLGDFLGYLDERVRALDAESLAMDAELVVEQQAAHEQLVGELDESAARLQALRKQAAHLVDICGCADAPSGDQASEVAASVDELAHTLAALKQQLSAREHQLHTTFGKACEFQQELIAVLEWIGVQQEKLANLDSSRTTPATADPKTICFQITLLDEFKTQVSGAQLRIDALNRRFGELKEASSASSSAASASSPQTSSNNASPAPPLGAAPAAHACDVLESLLEPLESANNEWRRLQASLGQLSAQLQDGLLRTGQLKDALDQMSRWMEASESAIDHIAHNEHNSSSSSSSSNNKSTVFATTNAIHVQQARLKVLFFHYSNYI